jgi:7,8-dihydropterin-6-yl-methyl-4-(beta-D-ribofuranosyl)aminobenzene 5'-phosphate synthase
MGVYGVSHCCGPAEKQVSILYEAFGKRSNLKKDWGYSALIEYAGKKILFDTGNNELWLRHNVEALELNLGDLDFVVLSHRHGDHTSGLGYVLRVNPGVTIYTSYEVSGFATPVLPAIVAAMNRHISSLPEHMRYFDGQPQGSRPSGSPWPNAHFVQVQETSEVASGFFLIPLVSNAVGTKEMFELSLAFRTSEGLVLIVGCSHPGIENIAQQAARLDSRIYSVFGGFHQLGATDEELQNLAAALHDRWRIEHVGPGHCSGLGAFAAFQNLYQQKISLCGPWKRHSFAVDAKATNQSFAPNFGTVKV